MEGWKPVGTPGVGNGVGGALPLLLLLLLSLLLLVVFKPGATLLLEVIK